MVRAGELPQRRTLLRAYLTEIREGLISDIAGSEPELTTAQRVLVDRAISLLSVLRCVEEHVRETGVFKGKELAPVLLKSYCTYSAELRRTLEMLGIKGKAADRAMTPLEIAAVVDAEKVEKAGQAGPGLAQAGRLVADGKDGQGADGPGEGDFGAGDEIRASGSAQDERLPEGEGQGEATCT
jgi:hypothetical protein